MTRQYQNVPGHDPSRRKGRQWPEPKDRPAKHRTENSPPDVDQNITNKPIENDNSRQQSGEWTHPVTNHDEQRKTTNADNGKMGEAEAEGI